MNGEGASLPQAVGRRPTTAGLPTVPHRRRVVWEPRVCTPTGAGSATPPLLLSRRGFGGTWLFCVGIRRPPTAGDTCLRPAAESRNCPIVPTWGRSCRGSRDEVSRHHENRRFSNDLGWVCKRGEQIKKAPTLTRFTPVHRTRSALVCGRDAKRLVNAVNGGILSLNQDRRRHASESVLVDSRRDAPRRAS